MLHERQLANDWGDLSHEQRTASLAAIGTAGDQLIRCSKELGLNTRPEFDPWSIPEPSPDAPLPPPATIDPPAGDPVDPPAGDQVDLAPDAPQATPANEMDVP